MAYIPPQLRQRSGQPTRVGSGNPFWDDTSSEAGRAHQFIDWEYVRSFETIQFSTPRGVEEGLPPGGDIKCRLCKEPTFRLLDEGMLRLPIDGRDLEKRLRASIGDKTRYYCYADINVVLDAGLFRPSDILRIFPWLRRSGAWHHMSAICHTSWVKARPLVCGCSFGANPEAVYPPKGASVEDSWSKDPDFKSSSLGRRRVRSPEARERRKLLRYRGKEVQVIGPDRVTCLPDPYPVKLKLKFQYIPPVRKRTRSEKRRFHRKAKRELHALTCKILGSKNLFTLCPS
jgi:hypothetical protein